MFKKLVRKKLNKFIEGHKTDLKVLDLGCGNSPYASLFSNRVGFDFEMNRGVDVIGDAHNLPFENESFDMILCSEVLEHLIDPKKAISEMNRVLKFGGKLVLTTRFIFPIHDAPHDYWRFTRYGLLELFKDWKIEKIIEEYDTIDTLAVIFQRIGFQSRARLLKYFNIIFFVLPMTVKLLKLILGKEYGDITKTHEEKSIISSGYYIVCTK